MKKQRDKAIASDSKAWVALLKCIDYRKPDWYCRKAEGWVVMSDACALVMIKAIAPKHSAAKIIKRFMDRDKDDTQGGLW